ncbi:MAG: hypothetical protein K2X07_10950, partial [Caulobacteraceae bacterium]|nr:hypothetical protein [Caulobacteraceae bacterium]
MAVTGADVQSRKVAALKDVPRSSPTSGKIKMRRPSARSYDDPVRLSGPFQRVGFFSPRFSDVGS